MFLPVAGEEGMPSKDDVDAMRSHAVKALDIFSPHATLTAAMVRIPLLAVFSQARGLPACDENAFRCQQAS